MLAEVERFDCPLVEVTGGEPLLQEEVYPLMEALLDRGQTVLLETGGHRSTARARRVVTILDVKCPGSGEAAPQRLDQPRSPAAARRGEVRHQGSRRLRLRADVVSRYELATRVAAIHLSPVHGVLDPRTLSEWVLADGCRCASSFSCTSTSGSGDARGLMNARRTNDE